MTRDPSVFIKAGGLVWIPSVPRATRRRPSPKYDDWSLPKGKREDKDALLLDTAQ